MAIGLLSGLRNFVLVAGNGLAGNPILALDPAPKVDQLATLRTERTKRIIFPLDWLTAGWALHLLVGYRVFYYLKRHRFSLHMDLNSSSVAKESLCISSLVAEPIVVENAWHSQI
jgi:hypothetical protein